MTLLRKFLLCACSALLTTSALAEPQITVRNVKSDLDTEHIIAPESFEVDVHNIMQGWYLTRYTVFDSDADKRQTVSFTDQEYIDRLQKLPTHIEMPYNSVVGSFIRMYVERKKGLVEAMLGLSLYYMPMFDDALDRYGLPMELRNLAIIESALNPNAVSRAGAAGLWQFMPSTAQGEGLEVNTLVDERRDPYKSTDAAARLLKKLYDSYGDWSLAIAAYNCGPGNVNKALRRAGGGKKDFWEIYNYLPAETRSYVPAFIAANYAMAYYKDHNISPVLASRPVVVDSVKVTNRVHFQQISDVLGIPMEELRALNPQYRADVIPGDIKPYTLTLPHLQTLCYISYEDSILNHNLDLYARRDVVEPGGQRKVTDANGKEYTEITTVRYHKVTNKETIPMIAQRYGVSQAEVIRANGGSKRLRRGKTLQLNVKERRAVASTNNTDNSSTQSTQPTAQTDNSGTDSSTDTSAATQSASGNDVAATSQPAQTTQQSTQVTKAMGNSGQTKDKTTAQKQQSQPTSHTVKSGDTLYSLAKKYGTTVDAIKKANGLKNDNIALGAKIKIPGKGGATGTAKKSSGKSGGKSSGKTSNRRKRHRR